MSAVGRLLYGLERASLRDRGEMTAAFMLLLAVGEVMMVRGGAEFLRDQPPALFQAAGLAFMALVWFRATTSFAGSALRIAVMSFVWGFWYNAVRVVTVGVMIVVAAGVEWGTLVPELAKVQP